MGQDSPSASLQMIQNWEEWLIDQVDILLSEGPHLVREMDQKEPNELQECGNAKSCT